MIDPNDRVFKNPRTAARVIDGKALVVVLDDKRLHTLNAVGTRIFELSDGRSLAQIAQQLCQEFEIDEATALADASVFVAELAGLGALECKPGSSPAEPTGAAQTQAAKPAKGETAW